MPFNVQCDCGARLVVRDDLSGMKGKCPSCGETIELIPISTTKPVAVSLDEVLDSARVEQNPPPSKIQSQTQRLRLRKKLLLAATCCLVIAGAYCALMGGRPSVNPLQSLRNARVQSAINRAIKADPRNGGVDALAYYQGAFSDEVLVFDLRDISGSVAPVDVFRALLCFADEVQNEPFAQVILSHKGEAKFSVDGNFFRKTGRDYGSENVIFTMRTFPENLRTPLGNRAYSEWSGGALGVLGKQLEDFNDFHRKWYMSGATF